MISSLQPVLQSLKELTACLRSDEIHDHARVVKSSFTRNRLIPLSTLLFFLIFRKGKTINEEISFFFQKHKQIPSKQALIKRESLLNFDIWKYINSSFHSILHKNGLLNKLYKGYRIIAIDGSTAALPSSAALNQLFGGVLTRKHPTKEDLITPVARLSAVYDVHNHFLLDFLIKPYAVSEIPMMFEQLDALLPYLEGQKVIFVLDRYYGSAEFFLWCEMHGFHYVVRAKNNFYKEERAAISEDVKDAEFTVSISYAWSRRIKKKDVRRYAYRHPCMKIRLIRSDFSYRQTRYFDGKNRYEKEFEAHGEFFTNLPDTFRAQEITEQIYKDDRWDLETCYDILKNDLELENVHSACPAALINMLYAKVILFNIEMVLYSCVQDHLEPGYIPNNRKIIQECQTCSFIEQLMEGALTTENLKKILKEAIRYKRLVRKGRHYQRWGRFFRSIPNKKFRIDGRANPKVIYKKGGYVTVSG